MIKSFKFETLVIYFLLLSIFPGCNSSEDFVLKNDDFCLVLSSNKNGIPTIKNGYWRKTGKVAFSDFNNNNTYHEWLPANLVQADSIKIPSQSNTWHIESEKQIRTAKASRNLGKLRMTWTIELSPSGSLFRVYLQLANTSDQTLPVNWYPIWLAGWLETTPEKCSLRTWEPLSYQEQVRKIRSGSPIEIHSSVYSSDNHDKTGSVPFWQLVDQSQTIYFSLAWCGGWQSLIYKNESRVNIDIKLPEQETQLILKPGETITGPKLYIFSSTEANQIQSRSDWLNQRERWADYLYPKPENSYPLIYNHWYSVRFDLSSQFIKNQLDAILPYQFDFFVIDAGWYNRVGDWTANRRLFGPGEFENAMKKVKNKGIKTGIWSCPWLIEIENEKFPPEIDEPPFYRKFMNAYALDLAGIDFEKILTAHIASLKRQFDIDWWKFDQELFGDSSRHGKMRNIIALEKSLSAVRQTFPDLYIENCMSGGRMINEFTDQISQMHWIRDGGSTGLKHAKSNILESLGAVQFLPPSKVERWTNRPDEIDAKDSELLKMYCRSAMIGVWGISADMNKIDTLHKEVILNEINNYRRLSSLKSDMLYDIIYPENESDIAGIIYYTRGKNKAAVLLFRWDKSGTISKDLKLSLIDKASYKINDMDTKQEIISTGNDLIDRGLAISIDEARLSALYFIERIE